MHQIKYYNTNKTEDEFESKLENAVSKITAKIKEDTPEFRIFSITEAKKQVKEFSETALEIQNNFTDLLVIAMGGSVLNPESLIRLNTTHRQEKTRVHYVHNTDPIYLKKILSEVNLQKCAVLTTSNSGQTLETNALLACVIKEFQNNNITDLDKRCFFITKPNEGILHDLAKQVGGKVIPHAQNISGRYSGLTNVSTLPSMIAGVDIDGYLEGAEAAINEFINNQAHSAPAIAAVNILASKKSNMINMGYLQQYAAFLEWYSQIISESLGKEGMGITPVRGLGPNDQHSMLQLYLEGPEDKFYSLFYCKNIRQDLQTASIPEFGDIAGKSLEKINEASFTATSIALSKQGLPLRTIIIEDLSAKSIGYLTANSMLEVVIIGKMMGINPFNQPGVELIKVESRKIMSTI